MDLAKRTDLRTNLTHHIQICFIANFEKYLCIDHLLIKQLLDMANDNYLNSQLSTNLLDFKLILINIDNVSITKVNLQSITYEV